ncbi:MAG: hypothetical protein HRT45_05895 [Bdellovibrionales bacterium]|nr:hypothetical protein [Bdellovibrionales bacterium]
MKALVLVVLFLGSVTAHAGSSVGVIDCTSASGKTKLVGEPDSSPGHNLNFSIEGSEFHYHAGYQYTSGQGSEYIQNSISQVPGGVSSQRPNYHFVVTSPEGEVVLTFVAKPGTIDIEPTAYGEAGTLEAYVVGQDPRNPSVTSPTIQVSCDYKNEI